MGVDNGRWRVGAGGRWEWIAIWYQMHAWTIQLN